MATTSETAAAVTIRLTASAVIRIVAALLLCAAIAIALLSVREYRRQVNETDRAYTRLIRLHDRVGATRKAIVALQDAETQEQNYVLTGETSYDERYGISVGEWKDEAGVLAVQATDDMSAMVQELIQSGDRTVGELAQIVSLCDAGSRDKALDRIRKGAGIVYLDQTRAIAVKIQEINDEAVNRADTAVRPSRSLLRLAESVAGLFCLTTIGSLLLIGTSGYAKARAE